jgi:hypothetical protein
MPGLLINLFTIQAILQNACLAVNLACARLFHQCLWQAFGFGDELNSITQTQNLSTGQ